MMLEEKTARKEKVCQEEQCVEQWEEMPLELKNGCAAFVYCPFCANEMITRCSACGESIHDVGFKYCPWCGARFLE
ncbi:MAG: hypothetical protein KQJ78_21140 [Deltaproteobacteria bacterium]|nr:hypothetical protein [Deltaproteobacteria bacterium]